MSAENNDLMLIQNGNFDVTIAMPPMVLAQTEIESLLRGEIVKLDNLKVQKLDLYVNKKSVGKVKLLKSEDGFVIKLIDNN